MEILKNVSKIIEKLIMRIGFGQILILILVALIFFGKFPKLVEDLTKGAEKLKNLISFSKDTNSKLLESKTKKEIHKNNE